MKARVGDWLLVKTSNGSRRARRAQVVKIGDNGEPPYIVRWLDDDREVMIFPAATAEIVSPERLAEIDEEQDRRILAAQSAIKGRHARH